MLGIVGLKQTLNPTYEDRDSVYQIIYRSNILINAPNSTNDLVESECESKFWSRRVPQRLVIISAPRTATRCEFSTARFVISKVADVSVSLLISC